MKVLQMLVKTDSFTPSMEVKPTTLNFTVDGFRNTAPVWGCRSCFIRCFPFFRPPCQSRCPLRGHAKHIRATNKTLLLFILTMVYDNQPHITGEDFIAYIIPTKTTSLFWFISSLLISAAHLPAR